jgi:hypothetical protein
VKKTRDGTTANSGEWVLDVRVVLVDSEPEIWRQLELRGSLTLVTVHRILQVAFGWKDARLHRFTESDPLALLRPIDGEFPDALQWLPAEWCEEPTDLAEEDCSLHQLLMKGSGTAFYEYDVGGSWLHRIELVSRRPAGEYTPPARLSGGARRGPLEDSGGLLGYGNFTDPLADPTHPDHAEYTDLVATTTIPDEPFAPGFLDIPEVTRTLIGR